jgi:hypothetical protein
MLRAIAIMLAFCAMTSFADASQADLRQSRLGSSDWSVKASPNLGQNPPPRKAVEDFIFSFESPSDAELSKEAGVYVCSFRFADLRHNGVLSLVYTPGIIDRPSCRGLSIVDKTSSGFESFGESGEIGTDAAAAIQDLRHDGHLEILLPYGLATFPQTCAANWTAIYAWTGVNYTNVSDQFRDFYQRRLDQLDQIIPALRPTPDKSGYSLSDKECLEAEASAIKRFLGVSPDAGIEQAIRLANSKDRLAREFGTVLLIKLGTASAREQLQKLTNDPDWAVRTEAKNGLSMPIKFKFAPPSFKK